jgi:hypothetical protein
MAISAARATAASRSVPSSGLIWMVTSSAICRCQFWACSAMMETAAIARQARKLMIATSVRRVRRATVLGGTIGLATRGGPGRPSEPEAIWPTSAAAVFLPSAGALRRLRRIRRTREPVFFACSGAVGGSLINVDMAAVQHETPCVVLVH